MSLIYESLPCKSSSLKMLGTSLGGTFFWFGKGFRLELFLMVFGSNMRIDEGEFSLDESRNWSSTKWSMKGPPTFNIRLLELIYRVSRNICVDYR